MEEKLMLKIIEKLTYRLIMFLLRFQDPKDALCFLFRMENFIYGLQGQKSVEYGNGVHTKHRHTRYHDFFIERIDKGNRVLDIGCGNGALSFDMADRSEATVFGIDIQESNIIIAKRRFSHPNVKYIVGDVLQFIPDEPFDIIVLSNVLEHLFDRINFLTSIHSLTKAKRILIRVPLFERDWRVPLKKELGVE